MTYTTIKSPPLQLCWCKIPPSSMIPLSSPRNNLLARFLLYQDFGNDKISDNLLMSYLKAADPISQTAEIEMSHNVRKPTMWILTRSDTNQAVQLLEMAKGLKFCIKEEEILHYWSCENKGADQLSGYRQADLRLCFRIWKRWFSHDAAQMQCG